MDTWNVQFQPENWWHAYLGKQLRGIPQLPIRWVGKRKTYRAILVTSFNREWENIRLHPREFGLKLPLA